MFSGSQVGTTIPEVNSNDINDVIEAINESFTVALIGAIAFAVLALIIAIVVARKAGYSGWWGAVVVLVPGVGLVAFIILALAKWPALKERDEALKILRENGIALPSHQRRAEKEAQQLAKDEAEAQRRADQARAQREKAERERDLMTAAPAVATGTHATTAPTPTSGTTPTTPAAAPPPPAHVDAAPPTDGSPAHGSVASDTPAPETAPVEEAPADTQPTRKPARRTSDATAPNPENTDPAKEI